MTRQKRLMLQIALALAASTLALATIRQTRHEPPSTSPERADRQASGQVAAAPTKASELPRRPDGSAKEQHRTVSPDGRRVIHHLPYDPYQASPAPVIFVASDNKTGKVLRKIQVSWPARYVSSVDWVDDRTVVVLGEARYLAVIDVEAGQQTHNLVGSNFALSPDGAQVIYSHDFNPRYGEVIPEYQSDYVLFSLVGRRQAGGVSGRFDSTNYKIVYPNPLPWGEAARKAVEKPADRHRIKIPFAWSRDSRKVAFVESHADRWWLVVFHPVMSENDITADVRRFELGGADKDVSSISWEAGGSRIRVTGEGTSLLVDTETRTIQTVPPPL